MGGPAAACALRALLCLLAASTIGAQYAPYGTAPWSLYWARNYTANGQPFTHYYDTAGHNIVTGGKPFVFGNNVSPGNETATLFYYSATSSPTANQGWSPTGSLGLNSAFHYAPLSPTRCAVYYTALTSVISYDYATYPTPADQSRLLLCRPAPSHPRPAPLPQARRRRPPAPSWSSAPSTTPGGPAPAPSGATAATSPPSGLATPPSPAAPHAPGRIPAAASSHCCPQPAALCRCRAAGGGRKKGKKGITLQPEAKLFRPQ